LHKAQLPILVGLTEPARLPTLITATKLKLQPQADVNPMMQTINKTRWFSLVNGGK